jgi:hypothetical protein
LVYVGLYRASWRVFGEVGGVRLMPALVIWLADVGFLGLPLLLGAARTANQWSLQDKSAPSYRDLALPGTLALVVLAVIKLTLWTGVPEGIAGWPTNWKRYFNFLYPWPVYRPLILAPMWGRWALILAGGVGPPASSEQNWASRSGHKSIAVTLGWFVAVAALTAVYCGRHDRWMIGCIISLAVLGTTFVFAVVTARRFSGHTRFTVHAAALVAEVTFLVVYLAASQHIYRY